MADEENPEETPAVASKPNDAESSERLEQDAAADETGESVAPPVETPVDQKEHLTPHRAAKLAGIGVLAALLVAVIVVATVWAVDAILDDDIEYVDSIVDYGYYERRGSDDYYYDDDYHERRDSGDGWSQYVDPPEFPDHFDGYWHGRGNGPSDYGEQWHKRRDWADKEHSAEPGSSSERGVPRRSCGSGPGSGPVVVVVLGGPGGWGYADGFGSGGPGLGAGAVLSDLVPFAQGKNFFDGEWTPGALSAEPVPMDLGGYQGRLVPGLAELFPLDLLDGLSALEGFGGAGGFGASEFHDESGLGVAEPESLSPPSKELTPT